MISPRLLDIGTINALWRPLYGSIVKRMSTNTHWPNPARGLVADIERAITVAVKRDSCGRKGKLYVSDLKYGLPLPEDGDCPKKLWGILRGEKQSPKTPGVDLMLHAGDRLHKQVGEWLKHNLTGGWKVVQIEQSLEVEGLRGRLDILLENGDLHLTAVLDIKTKRGAAFSYLHEPKAADVIQVQAYVRGKDANFGLLLYVDREGQNWLKIFVVPRNDVAVINYADDVKEIRRKAQAGEPVEGMEPMLVRKKNKGPDSLTVKWPWQVTWCPLEKCHCKARISKSLPTGIVAHIDNSGVVKMTDKYQDRDDLKDWIDKQLEAKNEV